MGIKVTEAYLEANLVKWVKSLGGTALKGATNFDTGFPDRLIFISGAQAYVEVKGTSTRYHLNDKQKIWAGRIIASGAPYYILETREQFDSFKEDVGKSNVIDGNTFSLNGFNLLLVIDSANGVYHISRRLENSPYLIYILTVPYKPEPLAHTIYRAFKAIEEYCPNTNYADIQ